MLPPAGRGAKRTGVGGSAAPGRSVRKGHQILSAPADRIAHTPLGELTGPPAVFTNNPEVRKVRSVRAAEERFQQAGFQQQQRDRRRASSPPRYV